MLADYKTMNALSEIRTKSLATMGGNHSVPKMYLEICADPVAAEFYKSYSQFHPDDSGLDLFIVEEKAILPGKVERVDLHVRCQAYYLKSDVWSRFMRLFKKDIPENHKIYTGYWVCPRSSISKKPVIMTNSIGVIDAEYVGNLQIPLRNVTDEWFDVHPGDRLCQIVGPNHNPIEYKLVPYLRDTSRGTGGFGSTDAARRPSTSGTLTPEVTHVQV